MYRSHPTRGAGIARSAAAGVTLGALTLTAPAETGPAGPAGAAPRPDAPAGDPVTLEAYLELALAANPGLRAHWGRYRAAREKIPQARALPDPTVSVSQFVESVQTRTGEQRNAFALAQPIPWPEKLRRRGEAAGAVAEALGADYRQAQLAVMEAVALAYHDLAYLGRATEITRQNLSLLRRLEPVVIEKVKGGGDTTALLRLEVEIGRDDDHLRTLERDYVRRAAQFNALLGQPPSAPLAGPRLDPPGGGPGGGARPAGAAAALRSSLLTANPELLAIAHRIEAAEAGARLGELARYPDFSIGANYIRTGPALNRRTPGSGEDPWAITVSLSLPIWGGKNRAAREEAALQLRAEEDRHADRRNHLLAALTAALEDLADAERRIELYGGSLVPKAKQAVEVSDAAYRGNRVGVLEFIDSQRTLLDLELVYWRAVADAERSRVRIATLTGQGTHPAPSPEPPENRGAAPVYPDQSAQPATPRSRSHE